MAAEEEEYVQASMPEVFVYKIPPKASAAGHKAADWKEQVWVGKLQVVTRGSNAAIKLVSDAGKVFALAPIRVGAPLPVEKVSDSSRYFVLRIENDKGQHAFIGVGFNNRSDAFDFNVAVQDVLKEVDSGSRAKLLDLGPSEDFTLKEGQTFTIKVNIDGKKKPAGAPAAGATGPAGKLAPPGAAPKLRAPGGAATSGAAAKPAAGDDLLGLGSSFGSMSVSGAPASAPAPAPAPAAAANDWVAF